MNQHDFDHAPTLTALPAYTEPPTEQFPAVSPDPRVIYVQAAPEPKNGFGITAFICGIAGAICGLIPILSVPAIAAGLIGFGFGMGGVKRLRAKKADNKVMTVLGVIVSVLAVVLGVIGMVIVQQAVDQLQTDLNNIGATPAALGGAMSIKDVPGRVKNHVKEHKELYIGIALGAGLAGITATIMRDVVQQPIGPGISGTASRGISVTGKRVALNNVSFIYANRQGPPSWVVRCLETGNIFPSQHAAATEMGLPETEISKHLNGLMDHVRGNHFERICLAA